MCKEWRSLDVTFRGTSISGSDAAAYRLFIANCLPIREGLASCRRHRARYIEEGKKMKRSPVKLKSSGTVYIAIASFATVLALFFLIGPWNNEAPVTSNPEPDEENPVINEPEETSYKELLQKFFKADGDVAHFQGFGHKTASFTETTTWINDDYVQTLVDNGFTTMQYIYRITDTDIRLVLSHMAYEAIAEPSIEELNAMDTIDLMLQAPFEQQSYDDFNIYKDVTIKTPYGTFSSILVSTSEQGLTINRYYVEELGLVAEIFQWDGGYGDESYLASINEPPTVNQVSEVEVYNESLQKTERYPIEDLSFVDPNLYEVKKDYYNLTYRLLIETTEAEFGVVNFACDEREQCSNIFVKKDGSRLTIITSTYGSYGNIQLTPNQAIAAIPIHKLEQNDTSIIERNQILLIDLNLFKELLPSAAPEYFDFPLYRIVDFSLANTSIKLTLADTNSTHYSAIAAWEDQTPQKVKEVTIPFD